LALFGAGLAVVIVGIVFWYFNRPLPAPINNQNLFNGITYTREVHREPRPLIAHIVKIDLTVPELEFLVTPADYVGEHLYRARTTSQFLDEFDLQLAINADFFLPWRDNGLFDYYPHVGDGVDTRGLTVSRGEIVTQGYAVPDEYATIYISSANEVSFERPSAEPFNAVSGIRVLQNGNALIQDTDNYLTALHPRTAVALDQTGNTLRSMVASRITVKESPLLSLWRSFGKMVATTRLIWMVAAHPHWLLKMLVVNRFK
jgi:hypothetical protein